MTILCQLQTTSFISASRVLTPEILYPPWGELKRNVGSPKLESQIVPYPRLSVIIFIMYIFMLLRMSTYVQNLQYCNVFSALLANYTMYVICVIFKEISLNSYYSIQEHV